MNLLGTELVFAKVHDVRVELLVYGLQIDLWLTDWFEVLAVCVCELDVWSNQVAPNLHDFFAALAGDDCAGDDFELVLQSVANLVERSLVEVEKTFETNIRALTRCEGHRKTHRACRQVAVQTLSDYVAVGVVLGQHFASVFDALDEAEVTNVGTNLNELLLPPEEVLARNFGLNDG